MNTDNPIETAREAQRLLEAARTAIAIIATMHDLLWQLHPDELLALQEDEENRVVELLAMALVDQAWPPEDDDYPFRAA